MNSQYLLSLQNLSHILVLILRLRQACCHPVCSFSVLRTLCLVWLTSNFSLSARRKSPRLGTWRRIKLETRDTNFSVLLKKWARRGLMGSFKLARTNLISYSTMKKWGSHFTRFNLSVLTFCLGRLSTGDVGYRSSRVPREFHDTFPILNAFSDFRVRFFKALPRGSRSHSKDHKVQAHVLQGLHR